MDDLGDLVDDVIADVLTDDQTIALAAAYVQRNIEEAKVEQPCDCEWGCCTYP